MFRSLRSDLSQFPTPCLPTLFPCCSLPRSRPLLTSSLYLPRYTFYIVSYVRDLFLSDVFLLTQCQPTQRNTRCKFSSCGVTPWGAGAMCASSYPSPGRVLMIVVAFLTCHTNPRRPRLSSDSNPLCRSDSSLWSLCLLDSVLFPQQTAYMLPFKLRLLVWTSL